MTIAMRVWI